MKVKFSLVLGIISLLLFISCGQDEQYSIKGKLDETSHQSVYLVYSDSANIKKDTISLSKGKFEYTNSSDTLRSIVLYMEDGNIWITFWAKNGDKINISGDVNYPELLEVKGGKTNNQLTNFRSENKDIIRRRQDITDLLKFNIEEKLSTQTSDDYYSEILQLNHSLKDKAIEFIKANPSSIASLVLMQDYVIDIETPEKVLQYLSLIEGDARTNALFFQLKQVAERLSTTAIGKPAPDFQLIDMENDTLSLNSFDDHYLYLTFDTCKSNIDKLIEISQSNSAMPLSIVSVSFGKDTLNLDMLTKNAKDKWHQVFLSEGWKSDLVALYNIVAITDNYLIDKDKIITSHNLSPDKINSLINVE